MATKAKTKAQAAFVQNLGISGAACNGRSMLNFARCQVMSTFLKVVLDPRSRRRLRPSGALTAQRAIATKCVPEAAELSEGRNSCCDVRARMRHR